MFQYAPLSILYCLIGQFLCCTRVRPCEYTLFCQVAVNRETAHTQNLICLFLQKVESNAKTCVVIGRLGIINRTLTRTGNKVFNANFPQVWLVPKSWLKMVRCTGGFWYSIGYWRNWVSSGPFQWMVYGYRNSKRPVWYKQIQCSWGNQLIDVVKRLSILFKSALINRRSLKKWSWTLKIHHRSGKMLLWWSLTLPFSIVSR